MQVRRGDLGTDRSWAGLAVFEAGLVRGAYFAGQVGRGQGGVVGSCFGGTVRHFGEGSSDGADCGSDLPGQPPGAPHDRGYDQALGQDHGDPGDAKEQGVQTVVMPEGGIFFDDLDAGPSDLMGRAVEGPKMPTNENRRPTACGCVPGVCVCRGWRMASVREPEMRRLHGTWTS